MSVSTVDVGVVAANSSNYEQVIVLTTSQNWSPQQDCIADVVVIGAGGSGALSEVLNTSKRPTGGAAGGFCKKFDLNLQSSVVYNATIGAGGVGEVGSNLDYRAGRNGGASSFTGSGITPLIANGGEGGVLIPRLSATIASGGGASGGDINLAGGDSGGETSGSSDCINGGANVDVGFGKNRKTHGNEQFIANGRGVLGDSKEKVLWLTSPVSMTGHGAAFINNLDFLGIIKKPSPAMPIATQYETMTMPITIPDIGVGGFCAAEANSNLPVGAYAQSGGMFAGGGSARTRSASSGGKAVAGNGGLGGGGGAVIGNSKNHFIAAGDGGDGIIFIAIKEYV